MGVCLLGPMMVLPVAIKALVLKTHLGKERSRHQAVELVLLKNLRTKPQ